MFKSVLDIEMNNTKEIAFNYFKRAANQGNPSAITNLGICYQNGEGVPKDITKAKQCFEESA